MTIEKTETFNLIATHLLKQGVKAINERGECQYRLGDKSCAAGCLIPDDEYDVSLEKNMVRDIVCKHGLKDWFGHDIDLVQAMQFIHDDLEPKDWPAGIELVKRIHGVYYSGETRLALESFESRKAVAV